MALSQQHGANPRGSTARARAGAAIGSGGPPGPAQDDPASARECILEAADASGGPPGPAQDDPASARERILEAADALFGQLGFEAAATRLIAERSGVNKALIHYHYATKDALFGAVLDRYYQRLAAAVRPALEAPLGAREKLLGVVEAYVDFLSGHQTFHRLVQREISGERHLDRILGHTLPLFSAGTAALEAAWPRSAEGDLRVADVLVSFHGMIISSFTYAPVLDRLLGADPLLPEELSRRKAHLRRMAELVMDALETPGAPGQSPGLSSPHGEEALEPSPANNRSKTS